MANQCETKVYQNYLHVRLQKEDEDSWISGEELQTDGSSDDEKPSELKSVNKVKKFSTKNREIEKTEQLKSSQSESISQDLSWYVKPFSTNTEPSSSSTALKQGSSRRSQSLTESLNLENRWRPKRGSLKLPHLLDDKLNEQNLEEIGNLCKKFLSLNNCVSSNEEKITKLNFDEFLKKYLQTTPEVEGMFKSIEKLDEELYKIASSLKDQKTKRIQLQGEMCREILNDNQLLKKKKEFELFLKFCGNDGIGQNISKEFNSVLSENEKKPQQIEQKKSNKFIQKNIELIKNIQMANLSLTDEEKQQLQSLLDDIDSFELTNVENDIDNKKSVDEDNLNRELDLLNAFHISDADKKRIDEIDVKLQKFEETQEIRKNALSSKEINELKFMKTINSNNILKKIDSKLSALSEFSNQLSANN